MQPPGRRRQPPPPPQDPAGPPHTRRGGRSQPPGKGGKRKRIPKGWRWAIRLALGGFALGCGILGALVAYAALTLPSLDNIGQATATIKVVDRNGTAIAEYSQSGHNRTNAPLGQVGQTFQDAIVSVEDKDFYSEGALNIPRIMKALLVDVVARRPDQGASTITQQLAKQAFLSPDKTPLRKLREALLANEIDSKYSKPEILEKYINIIFYGEGYFGVEDASIGFFGRHAKDLDLRTASLLAGLPNAPTAYDPRINIALTYKRQHVVLAAMVANGKVGQAEADAVDPLVGGTDVEHTAERAANQAAIQAELAKGKSTQASGNEAPHFVQHIKNEIAARYKDNPSLLTGTITVTTTLDVAKQRVAQQLVTAGVAKFGNGANNGALEMMDSHTGDILVMVGSANFNDDAIAGQYNVTTGSRQMGSAFKPLVYEQAFKSGVLGPNSIVDDTVEMGKKYGVSDYDSANHTPLGRITAARCLLESRNICTEQIADIAGINNVIDFAHTLGITDPLAPNLNTSLGSSAVNMTDNTAAYAAFANGGTKVTPRSILKMVDQNGNVLDPEDAQPPAGDQVMTPQQAYSITNILEGYAGRWGHKFKFPTAGKSGTTGNFVDAWYMTYTPDWVVSTWTGHTDQTKTEISMSNNAYGNTVADDISVPFVNTLNKPSPFKNPGGKVNECGSQGGCATPTPAPTPVPTPTPTPSDQPTETPPAGPTPSPPIPIPTLFTTPTPKPSPSPLPPGG